MSVEATAINPPALCDRSTTWALTCLPKVSCRHPSCKEDLSGPSGAQLHGLAYLQLAPRNIPYLPYALVNRLRGTAIHGVTMMMLI